MYVFEIRCLLIYSEFQKLERNVYLSLDALTQLHQIYRARCLHISVLDFINSTKRQVMEIE